MQKTISHDLLKTTFHQVDDDGKLYISPAIHEWAPIEALGVDTVFDMDSGLDHCIPTHPDGCVYVYFPIFDEGLPPRTRLNAVGKMGADLIREGHGVLSHCGMGFNRSALVAGVILHNLGMRGPDIVQRIRERRPGALFNDVFAGYLDAL